MTSAKDESRTPLTARVLNLSHRYAIWA